MATTLLLVTVKTMTDNTRWVENGHQRIEDRPCSGGLRPAVDEAASRPVP